MSIYQSCYYQTTFGHIPKLKWIIICSTSKSQVNRFSMEIHIWRYWCKIESNINLKKKSEKKIKIYILSLINEFLMCFHATMSLMFDSVLLRCLHFSVINAKTKERLKKKETIVKNLSNFCPVQALTYMLLILDRNSVALWLRSQRWA